ncbi:MAG: isoprenylcysteine carboxylmethyltransferase family protein [Proteobacteria bacterium]|nr:isoprenylcysteine carboxylmethyltransferase family protein [Pseudomonadota bacterium]
MKRLLILLYGLASYLVFFATFLYAVGFIGNFGVPKAIDSPAQVPFGAALLTNLGLLLLFAIQHSVMARPAFKRRWTRLIPVEAERSTYVLLSSLALIALFAWWQPMGGVIWSVESPVGRAVLWGLYAFGLGLVLLSTFLINHFDLFGLRQVWLQLIGRPYTPVTFRTPWIYQHVRHPLYVGWLFTFWSTPVMTAAHLVLALATTAYMLIAIQFEEHDLVAEHPEYAEYRRTVPMLIPFTRRRTPAARLALRG